MRIAFLVVDPTSVAASTTSAPSTDPSADPEPTDDPPATPAGGGCTATGEVSGGYEATFTDAPAYGSFLGEEGAYGIKVADGVALDIFVLASGETSMMLTGPDVLFSNNGQGLVLGDDGATIDAEPVPPPALGDVPAVVVAAVTCT